mmetsp:Transcript_25594/g.60514  ORF Transcript_25594/g.60514 Transcript_25594/m.60514 type:complete len:144 (+) Transcript_25594:634-1065(+)
MECGFGRAIRISSMAFRKFWYPSRSLIVKSNLFNSTKRVKARNEFKFFGTTPTLNVKDFHMWHFRKFRDTANTSRKEVRQCLHFGDIIRERRDESHKNKIKRVQAFHEKIVETSPSERGWPFHLNQFHCLSTYVPLKSESIGS